MPDFRGIKEFIKDTMGYIIAFVVIAIIFKFVIAFSPIAGNSMNPTFNDGDLVMVSRFSYVIGKPKRDDIIIFKDSNKKKFIKRIIGLPGETIDYLNGYLYINEESYKENIVDGTKTNNFMFVDICDKTLCPDGIIPEDKYLVLGDSRNDSQDSRDPQIGLVSKKQIVGKIFFKIFPFDDFGKIK